MICPPIANHPFAGNASNGANSVSAAPARASCSRYQRKDRLSFMPFVGLVLHDPVPDSKTIRL
jgi:hypothetical protein